MYINSRTGAVQGMVAVYKRRPPFWTVRVPWGAHGTTVRCPLCPPGGTPIAVSDILLTTLHVITDWPISEHMIGTSHRGPVQQLVFHCVLLGSAH
ncbi:unnamed protein product, partial [Staurois parvus]